MRNTLPILPSDWGLFPTVFGLPSYPVLALLAVLAGTISLLLCARRRSIGLESTAIVLVFALVGAGIGAKLPILLMYWNEFLRAPSLSGKTMLGGVAGALLATAFAKRLFHIHEPFGDSAAPSAALALAIGRIGCLGAGCCYGKPAPWGIDLGDGITRWPTQLLESAFHLLALPILFVLFRRERGRGLLLPGYLSVYLVFRYFTEFLREGTPVFVGQTVYQWFCIGGLLILAAWVFFSPARRAGNRFR